MSAYENVVVGKLKLKGKALDVKSGSAKKKKHKKLRDRDHVFQVTRDDQTTGGSGGLSDNLYDKHDSHLTPGLSDNLYDKHDSHLTPAERRYLEHWEKINIRRLAKEAMKSHRDRIQEFNQYLANLSEHYDIPKVGPG
ncbi:protein FAM32A-like isoform X1 [Ipomoea triloba]|uniref:protein FAM32A-like isoform X1 n=1 Tax=Ipomoea triloba TaxID=35885 RepID=UPI00125E4215|nr:protein FAM32A-like isoform X1 [Ipomoea triloba]